MRQKELSIVSKQLFLFLIQYFLPSKMGKLEKTKPPVNTLKHSLKQLLKHICHKMRTKTSKTHPEQTIKKLLYFVLHSLNQHKYYLCQHNLRSYVFNKYSHIAQLNMFNQMANTQCKGYNIRGGQVDPVPQVIDKVVECQPLFVKVPVCNTRQNYESIRPCYVYDYYLLYTDQLSQIVCALANTGCGGQLLLAKSHDGNKILAGLHQFSKAQAQNIQNKLQKSACLLHFKHLRRQIPIKKQLNIKVSSIPVFQTLQNFLLNRFDQFVIKISIQLNPFVYQYRYQVRHIFYLEHRLSKNIPSVCQLWTFNNDSEQASIEKLCGEDIYDKMLQIAKLNRKFHIVDYPTHYDCSSDQLCIDMSGCIMKGEVVYQLSTRPHQLLPSMLKCLSQDNLQHEFPLIEPTHQILHVQVPQSSLPQIQHVQKCLKSLKIVHKILHPLHQFQQSVINHYKSISVSIPTYYIFYIIYPAHNNTYKCVHDALASCATGLSVGLLKSKMQIHGLGKEQANYVWDFLYDRFCAVPRIKSQGGEGSSKKESISVEFAQFDKHAALFTFLIMTLMRKIPKCTDCKNALEQQNQQKNEKQI